MGYGFGIGLQTGAGFRSDSREMMVQTREKSSSDFMQWLGVDMSIQVLMHLDDPSDLVRICAVSSSWRQFVIEHCICKKLLLRRFPAMCTNTNLVEDDNLIEPLDANGGTRWEWLKRNHKVYAFLAGGLSPVVAKECISEAICASSTDNYPEETIQNTLQSRDRVENPASYWSSKGQAHADVPERLVYKLASKLCLVSEIHLQPFQAYFQYGFPIYSSKNVRFRLGRSKFPTELEDDAAIVSFGHKAREDNFVWTYTSPEFAMAQDTCLQKFKLPEPVLCIGGILQVELLGRVQRQEIDGLYYICLSNVQAVGQPLVRPFDVELTDSTGECTLKYVPERENSELASASLRGKRLAASLLRTFVVRLLRREGRDHQANTSDQANA
ncbi:F-box protein At4g00755 [Linum grandiflorum]